MSFVWRRVPRLRIAPTSAIAGALALAATVLAVPTASQVAAAAGGAVIEAAEAALDPPRVPLTLRSSARPTGFAGVPGGGVFDVGLSAPVAGATTAHADRVPAAASEIGAEAFAIVLLLAGANALAFGRRSPEQRPTLAEQRLQLLRALSS